MVTYIRLKDIIIGAIPPPFPKLALAAVMPNMVFGNFLDDDFSNRKTFEDLFIFLFNYYFPRLAWAILTLNSTKYVFGTDTFNILGF